MSELVFEVHQEEDGGYWAKSVGEGIFTQGDTWEELKAMVLDATKSYFSEAEMPDKLLLHVVTDRDEVLKVA
jgi:predicted RNase H-like HicB family nuclease